MLKDTQAEVLLKDASLRKMEKAPMRNHVAYFTWMHNEKPLNAEKREFMNNADDFVSISRHTERRFEDFIESWLDDKDPKFFIKVRTSGIVMTTESRVNSTEGR